jgi:hypothetical protein
VVLSDIVERILEQSAHTPPPQAPGSASVPEHGAPEPAIAARRDKKAEVGSVGARSAAGARTSPARRSAGGSRAVGARRQKVP